MHQFMPNRCKRCGPNGTITTINNGGITVGPEDNIVIKIVANPNSNCKTS